jgi:hypothetical protein
MNDKIFLKYLASDGYYRYIVMGKEFYVYCGFAKDFKPKQITFDKIN